jgi:hypothetical protein
MKRILLLVTVAFIVGVVYSGSASAQISYVKTINIGGKDIRFSNDDFKKNFEKGQAATPTGDTSGKVSKQQIKELAEQIGLLQESETNPHLSFLPGDIAYWFETGLSLKQLRLQFSARKAVIDAADRAKVRIADQGKLSWASQEIMAQMLDIAEK